MIKGPLLACIIFFLFPIYEIPKTKKFTTLGPFENC